ncbi:MAG: hypothetical protein QXZ09_06620, partial [Candidatus Methanomethylicaceae archaeon]
PDAPMGTWVHWVIYNIPPTRNGLEKQSLPRNAWRMVACRGKTPGDGSGMEAPARPPARIVTISASMLWIARFLWLPAPARNKYWQPCRAISSPRRNGWAPLRPAVDGIDLQVFKGLEVYVRN